MIKNSVVFINPALFVLEYKGVREGYEPTSNLNRGYAFDRESYEIELLQLKYPDFVIVDSALFQDLRELRKVVNEKLGLKPCDVQVSRIGTHIRLVDKNDCELEFHYCHAQEICDQVMGLVK